MSLYFISPPLKGQVSFQMTPQEEQEKEHKMENEAILRDFELLMTRGVGNGCFVLSGTSA